MKIFVNVCDAVSFPHENEHTVDVLHHQHAERQGSRTTCVGCSHRVGVHHHQHAERQGSCTTCVAALLVPPFLDKFEDLHVAVPIVLALRVRLGEHLLRQLPGLESPPSILDLVVNLVQLDQAYLC